jgi:Ca2+:H+ antiporter
MKHFHHKAAPMTSRASQILSWALPIGSLVLAIAVRLAGGHIGTYFPIATPTLAIGMLLTTVFIVLQHAEILAIRLGQPYGTLLLTFAVTIIEVSIIVSMMLHGDNNPTLARQSVFSTVMIVCAGIVGLCLTLGGWQHYQQDLKRQGTSAFLSVLTALTVITLILPNFILARTPGSFDPVQLGFVSFCSVLLYGSFVFAQTGRHRDDFLDDVTHRDAVHGNLAASPSAMFIHAALLMTGLVGIVLLAEQVAMGVEDGLAVLHVDQRDKIVGTFIALLVLLPEALSAVRAAIHNELQRSLNIALGSALATIGLTIPAVGIASLVTGRELTLGLTSGDAVLLVLVLAISIHSFGTGRTTVLTGLVHLVIFIAFLLLIAFP